MGFKSKFISYPFHWNDVPIDLSFIFEDEKPAGKHGFLKVKGDKFVFEDDTEARFWGTNFNSGLNFPPFEFSEIIAKRLAKIGINIVRLHQMDAEWATPNIFEFSKGMRKGNTLDLDPQSMKRLDYLIYCLKQEGIYIYLDLLTYRKFKTGDGVENAFKLADAAKPYNNYSRKLIELQKKFCYDLWNHINPHTGLSYKDEPAIVLVEVANETHMFMFRDDIPIEPYKTELIDMYIDWCAKRKIELSDKDRENIDFSSNDNEMVEFLREIQEGYYCEMMDFMREMGVKIPITGTNWSVNAANQRAQAVTDFTDGHGYWYDWKWGEYKKIFNNTPMVSVANNSLVRDLSFCRVLGKPYIVSEWDDPWPNEWRAESPIFLAALGSFQDWGGAIIHTYSYSPIKELKVVGKEFSSNTIGNIPYREGVFATWNDPAKFGLFYHAALLFRRKDIDTAKKILGVEIDDMNIIPSDINDLGLITEKHKVGIMFKDKTENICDKRIKTDEKIIEEDEGEVISDTEQLKRSWKKRIGIIDSKKTKVVYGFLGKAGNIKLNGLEMKVSNPFAVLAMSSLSDDAIKDSNNLLFTTIGYVQNSEMEFKHDGDYSELIKLGQLPVQIEVIEADISLKTNNADLKIWAVNSEGFYIGAIPSNYKDGILKFKVGESFNSIYYLIQAE